MAQDTRTKACPLSGGVPALAIVGVLLELGINQRPSCRLWRPFIGVESSL